MMNRFWQRQQSDNPAPAHAGWQRRISTAIAFWSTAVVTALVVAGCSPGEPVDDEVPVEQQTNGPHAEELQNNPCANPQWDEPPPEVTSLEE